MTTKEKLIIYIKYKGISKKRFYDITGFSNGFLDSGKYIGTDKLQIILGMFPDLSFNWLILDEGEMISEIGDSSSAVKEIENNRIIVETMEKHIKALTDLIEEKERLIIEKERVIEILMKN